MRVLDASSIIYAWDNYPFNMFPSLWNWMGERMRHGELQISTIAFSEVAVKTSDCTDWMKAQPIIQVPVTTSSLAEAMKIKKLLGIDNDNYHPKGVGENDLIIISLAKTNAHTLITEEEKQLNFPNIIPKCKIPAVCRMPAVNVACMNFLDYIKNSGQCFG